MADHARFVDENLKRNYRANFIHGVLGMTGFRLIYAPTIIPAYLYLLTGSAAAVGLGTALLQLGGTVSPILSGAQVESRKRILPYAVTVGSLMRVMVLALAIAAWTLEGMTLLVVTLASFLLLGFFSGAQRVAFQMLMAKLIPIDRRGRLQGIRNMAGGLIAAGLAWVAGHYFIEQEWLGNGYATTFLLAFILTSIGLFVLKLGIREPDAPRLRPVMPLRDRIGQFGELLPHRDFRAFLFAHGLAAIARVGLPFWTLYVGDRLGLDGALRIGQPVFRDLGEGFDHVGHRLGDGVGVLAGFARRNPCGSRVAGFLDHAREIAGERLRILDDIGVDGCPVARLVGRAVVLLSHCVSVPVAFRILSSLAFFVLPY